MVLVVLSVAMLVTLTACNSDNAASGAGMPSAFRNLGKRSDSSLGERRGSATTR